MNFRIHNKGKIKNISKMQFYNLYQNFDWKFYVQYNDFVNSNINNEQDAINHYWFFGRNENRRTHKVVDKIDISKVQTA